MTSNPSDATILIAHGGGGEMTRQLLERHVFPALKNPLLDPLDDSALLPAQPGRLCMTTDAFVVQPLFFPGGDIGKIAICGTVNDLAVMGAKPIALSLALVLEEGLPMAILERVMASLGETARLAGVPVCTGDTKVVERGRGDGLHITTTGLGLLPEGEAPSMERVRPGDKILISGRVAEHGLAIMSAREGFAFETTLESDVACLHQLAGLLTRIEGLRFMRDPTRGGVAELLCDLAETTGLTIAIEEKQIPLSAVCRHTAELLGLDPLSVANEGKIVAVVAPEKAEAALEACRSHPLGRHAALIGTLREESPPLVELQTRAGGSRIIQRPYGEELPRIC